MNSDRKTEKELRKELEQLRRAVAKLDHGNRHVARMLPSDGQWELALRESAAFYRALFTSLPVGIGVIRLDGKVLLINDALFNLLGYKGEEIKGVDIDQLYPDLSDRARILERLARDRVIHDYKVRIQRRDGTTFLASLTAVIQTLELGEVVLVVVTDTGDLSAGGGKP